jgi:hypothetical protein
MLSDARRAQHLGAVRATLVVRVQQHVDAATVAEGAAAVTHINLSGTRTLRRSS